MTCKMSATVVCVAKMLSAGFWNRCQLLFDFIAAFDAVRAVNSISSISRVLQNAGNSFRNMSLYI